MPVFEINYFYADCDECGWVSDDQEYESQAQELLDKHIRANH